MVGTCSEGAPACSRPLYALSPQRLAHARAFLDAVSGSWDRAIERLRHMVEEE
jgi:hypothetical protein